jgi:hypothetical protein
VAPDGTLHPGHAGGEPSQSKARAHGAAVSCSVAVSQAQLDKCGLMDDKGSLYPNSYAQGDPCACFKVRLWNFEFEERILVS